MNDSRPAAPSPLARVLKLLPARDPSVRFQHVMEQMPAAAFLVQPRVGRFVTINSRAAALTGWTRAELTQHSLAELLSEPMSREALALFHGMEPGSVRHVTDVPFRARAGSSLLLDLRLSAYLEDSEVFVLAIARLCEERYAQTRAEEQLLTVFETSARLISLLANVSPDSVPQALSIAREMLSADAVGLYRVDPSRPQLELEPGSSAGFPPTIEPGQASHFRSPFVWASDQNLEEVAHSFLRAGNWATAASHPVGDPPATTGVLVAAYHAGSHPPPHLPSSLMVVARMLDQLTMQLTRQTTLEDARRLAIRLDTRLAVIAGGVTEGIVILTGEGTIDDLNGSAALMLGYRREDVIGLPSPAVLVGEPTLAESVSLAAADGAPRDVEVHLHRRDGEVFPVSAQVFPLPRPDNGCLLLLQDLSEARADEVHREHLDHLAFIGQTTGAFAHEVRTPLNNISVGVQYLATRLANAPDLQPYISQIQADCNRLSTLMNDMLAWTRPVDPVIAPTDLTALLGRLLNRWNSKIQQRNVRLVFTPAESCPPALADARLIERVFVNLIENALQVMPAGGHLTVTLQPVSRGLSEPVLEVKVGDSGPGIPEDAQRRIFDPYFTTRPDGTGLGLAICKRIVTVHRGAISADSFPGTGTIFTVTLPMAEGDTPA
jgi:PAS domain S-box-containing protein